MAETKAAAELAFDAFIESYTPKYEKAADCLSKDRDTLLAFYDFPAEQWKHLRTTNPIESTFATVRHRTIPYLDMEPHLRDVVRMGEIASMLFDDPDQGRFIFAVTHLDDMLREFRARYPKNSRGISRASDNEGAGSGPRLFGF